MIEKLGDLSTMRECDFPVKIDENTLEELGTLINLDEMTGQDIPDDMLDAIVNYQ